jgi:hypothetical protein
VIPNPTQYINACEKVLSVGDGDTIRVTCPTGINKTTVRLAKLPMAMMQERYCISNYQTSTGAI